jgi:hypothetical protein
VTIDHEQQLVDPGERPEEVRLTPKTLHHLEELMASSVEKGIRESMNEQMAEMFWASGLKMLQKGATEHAGRFVIGGLLGLAKKLGYFLVLGGLVYAAGGWTALAGLFKALFTTNSS